MMFLMKMMMTNTTAGPNVLLSNHESPVRLPQRGAPVVVGHLYRRQTKHRYYPRRVVPRRLNILARQEQTTTTMTLYHQANPTDVWPRFVRFANPTEELPVNTTASSVTARDNSNAASVLPGDNREEEHYDTSSSSNNDQCWYSEKDYGRILAENQHIIELGRKILDQQGSIEDESIPCLKGLECYLSPEEAERRQRKVTDHARRMLSTTTAALSTIG
jgi:hypothetical protein